jgi:hypothetical protein
MPRAMDATLRKRVERMRIPLLQVVEKVKRKITGLPGEAVTWLMMRLMSLHVCQKEIYICRLS